jgi:hypothetical protein
VTVRQWRTWDNPTRVARCEPNVCDIVSVAGFLRNPRLEQ